jgi:cell wall-associated NlpC family hydrolase
MDDLIGIPFTYGGRGPSTFDCYGLVMECARRAGQTLPDFGFSDNQSLNAAMMGATMPQWAETPCAAGAIVLLRTGRHVSHVGYMLDQNKMIHTWEQSGGVTVQRIEDWKQRIVGFYKYVGN